GLAGVLLGAAALSIATGLVAAVVRFPPPKQAHRSAIGAMRRLCCEPLVLALASLLFFESGNEFVLGGYFATFLTREIAVPIDRASYLLAAYWAALVASRFALSRALLYVGGHAVILGGALVSIAGALITANAGTAPAAVAGIVLTGVALAGIF